MVNFSNVHFPVRISPGFQIFSMVVFKIVSNFFFKIFVFLTPYLSGSADSMLIDESMDVGATLLGLES